MGAQWWQRGVATAQPERLRRLRGGGRPSLWPARYPRVGDLERAQHLDDVDAATERRAVHGAVEGGVPEDQGRRPRRDGHHGGVLAGLRRERRFATAALDVPAWHLCQRWSWLLRRGRPPPVELPGILDV